MKSKIQNVDRWGKAQPQRDDTKCSAHGKNYCMRDLVATVIVEDEGSSDIHWTVCQHWLDNEPDVAEFDARHG